MNAPTLETGHSNVLIVRRHLRTQAAKSNMNTLTRKAVDIHVLTVQKRFYNWITNWHTIVMWLVKKQTITLCLTRFLLQKSPVTLYRPLILSRLQKGASHRRNMKGRRCARCVLLDMRNDQCLRLGSLHEWSGKTGRVCVYLVLVFITCRSCDVFFRDFWRLDNHDVE